MAAVRARNNILVVEVHAHAHGTRLLPGIEVSIPRYFAFGQFDVQPILECSNRPHLAIGSREFIAAKLHRILPSGNEHNENRQLRLAWGPARVHIIVCPTM